MSALTTLFAPGLAAEPGSPVDLDGDEVRHLRAARLQAGAELRLTNGDGRLWAARLDSLEGNRARCVVLHDLPSPADLDVELAFGIGSKPRTLWLVEKAVELGVSRLQPVEFSRSRSVADAARAPAFWRKARRRAAAALTQCGGCRLPALEGPLSLEEYLSRSDAGRDGPRIALERRGDESLPEVLSTWTGAGGPARLLVGPEGGMTGDERAACRAAGFRLATLGERVLRFETAAIVGVAAAGLLGKRAAWSTDRSGSGRADGVPS